MHVLFTGGAGFMGSILEPWAARHPLVIIHAIDARSLLLDGAGLRARLPVGPRK